jgi:hypothetical protein
METIEQIKNYIAKGETDKAIALLIEYTKKTNSPKQDDAILLSGQYRQWKREISLGIEQSSSELRRIEMTVMTILQEKQSNASAIASREKQIRTSARHNTPPTNSSKEKNKMMPILLAILGVMILGIGYMFLNSENQADYTAEQLGTPTEAETSKGDVRPAEKVVLSNTPSRTETSKAYTPPIEDDNHIVNGLDVNWVSFGIKQGFPEGYIKQRKDGTWRLTEPRGEETIRDLSEIDRDKFSVMLLDERNDLEILIDMEDMKVFADDGNKEFPLGRIWTWGTGY